MPDERADTPTTALLDALDVKRNLKRGLVVGAATAGVAYLYRVGALLGPVASTRGSPALFLLLALVLAVSTAALVTIVLTVRSAIRLARGFDEPS